jgi:hypothetical protein
VLLLLVLQQQLELLCLLVSPLLQHLAAPKEAIPWLLALQVPRLLLALLLLLRHLVQQVLQVQVLQLPAWPSRLLTSSAAPQLLGQLGVLLLLLEV